jgi:hypothetical protein
MTIVAVSMVTESGDHYLSLFTGILCVEDFVERVEDNMGDELGFACTINVCSDGATRLFLDALLERRDQLLEERYD